MPSTPDRSGGNPPTAKWIGSRIGHGPPPPPHPFLIPKMDRSQKNPMKTAPRRALLMSDVPMLLGRFTFCHLIWKNLNLASSVICICILCACLWYTHAHSRSTL